MLAVFSWVGKRKTVGSKVKINPQAIEGKSK
jgi:hypothetical protein